MRKRITIASALLAIQLVPMVADATTPLQTFVKPASTNFARFGESVVGVGSDVLVSGEDCHAAYLFSGTSGNLLQTYPSPFPANNDGFGSSAASEN